MSGKSTDGPAGTHVVSRVVASTRSELAELVDAPLWSMAPTETVETLAAVRALAAQVAELEARVLLHAQVAEVPAGVGAGSLTDWLRSTTAITRWEAAAQVRTAAWLEKYAVLRAGLAAGAFDAAKAGVVGRALDKLPDHVGAEVVELAEEELVRLAPAHNVTELKFLGKRILDVVAPEVSEGEESRSLERDERQALEDARFTMAEDGEGRTHGRFTIPTAVAAMLRAALLKLTPPGPASGGPRRMGQAFADWIEDRTDPEVVVTMSLDTLLGGTRAATLLDSGDRISAGDARRLACRARILPMVLDGRSEVLDLGRGKRFFQRRQRTAIAVRDQTCTTQGCDKPASLCHFHHDQPWSRGGRTDVAGGRMLCGHHHRRIHDSRYETTHLPGNKVAFTRRT